jgi:hypothetical protein
MLRAVSTLRTSLVVLLKWALLGACTMPLVVGQYSPAVRAALAREMQRRQARCSGIDRCIDPTYDSGFSEDCELNCMSPQCHAEIYGDDPLEEGEIDHARSRKFRACVATEMKALARQSRQRARE